MGILNNYEKYTENDCNVKGQAGRDGIGFKLTDDGNYDIDGKRLTNVADSIDDSDAVSLKVLKDILKSVKIIIIYNRVLKYIKGLVTRVN